MDTAQEILEPQFEGDLEVPEEEEWEETMDEELEELEKELEE